MASAALEQSLLTERSSSDRTQRLVGLPDGTSTTHACTRTWGCGTSWSKQSTSTKIVMATSRCLKHQEADLYDSRYRCLFQSRPLVARLPPACRVSAQIRKLYSVEILKDLHHPKSLLGTIKRLQKGNTSHKRGIHWAAMLFCDPMTVRVSNLRGKAFPLQ